MLEGGHGVRGDRSVGWRGGERGGDVGGKGSHESADSGPLDGTGGGDDGGLDGHGLLGEPGAEPCLEVLELGLGLLDRVQRGRREHHVLLLLASFH